LESIPCIESQEKNDKILAGGDQPRGVLHQCVPPKVSWKLVGGAEKGSGVGASAEKKLVTLVQRENLCN